MALSDLNLESLPKKQENSLQLFALIFPPKKNFAQIEIIHNFHVFLFFFVFFFWGGGTELPVPNCMLMAMTLLCVSVNQA